jgi:hypothetical protein
MSVFMIELDPHTSRYIMLFKILKSDIQVKSYKLICELQKKFTGALFFGAHSNKLLDYSALDLAAFSQRTHKKEELGCFKFFFHRLTIHLTSLRKLFTSIQAKKEVARLYKDS